MKSRKMFRTFITMMLCFIMAFSAPLSILADTPDEQVLIQEAAEHRFEPISEPAAEPVSEPVSEPAQEPVSEPTAEPSVEFVTEPISEPVAEAVSKLAEEPVSQPAADTIPADYTCVTDPIDSGVPNSGAANPGASNPGSDNPGPGQAGYKVADNVADAEKYLERGYDANLCWAATAANMLWEGNYGREAVNPLTNQNFKSEDEIFDYFRKCFTDDTGEPEEAVNYFIKGTYYGNEGYAQLRNGAPRGGLISGFSNLPEGSYTVINQASNNNILTSLGDMLQMSVAGWLRWWDTDQNKFDSSAHWLTVVSYEMIDDQCTGIWLVDSDNDTVIPEGQQAPGGRTDAQKAAFAAGQPNTRTYYPVTWQQIDDMYYWVVEGYLGQNETVKAVLAAVDYLKYMMLSGGGDPDEDAPDPVQTVTDNMIDNVIDTDSHFDTDKYSRSDRDENDRAVIGYVTVNPETKSEENAMQAMYDLIRTMMIENGQVCLAPMGNVYDTNSRDGYSLIIRMPYTSLVNVYVDGVRLSGNGKYYTITRTPNGMFIITFTKEYLKLLGAGEHSIKMELNGTDDVDTSVIIR